MQTQMIYEQFRSVQGELVQPGFTNRNYVTRFSLSMMPGEQIACALELECARTPRQTYGFRGAALAVYMRILDDIAGDLCTITWGMNGRGVTGRYVRDISSPYAAYVNGEMTLALGKEFATSENHWTWRGFVLGSVGISNQGAPWNRSLVSLESLQQQHLFQLYAVGYFGYGTHRLIDIDAFHGWSRVHHQSIDVGISYAYHFLQWGDLSVSYEYRCLAKLYPEKNQAVMFSYFLPFSLF